MKSIRTMLILFVILVVVKGNSVTGYILINREAISSTRIMPTLGCPWVIDREMRFGQLALGANAPAIAKSYLDRIFFISGHTLCSDILPQWGNKQFTDDKWGQFVVFQTKISQDKLPAWLSMWAWAGKWQLVKSVASASIEQYPNQLFGYYYLAQAWLHENNVQQALDVYLSASKTLSDSALPYREIARLYHYQFNNVEQSLFWYQASLTRAPEEPTALVGIWLLTKESEHSLTSDQIRNLTSLEIYPITKLQSGNKYILKGYTLDKELFKLSQGVDIELYGFWEVNDPATKLPGKLLGRLWVTRERTSNLAPNALFAWDQTTGQSIIPHGYQDLSWEGTILTDHALVKEQRTGEMIVCAQLLNTTYYKTGFFSFPISTRQDSCYLQSSWIKSSNNGNAYIGYQWLGDAIFETNNYDYTTTEVHSLGWAHYAGTAMPLLGSQRVRLRLLNYLATSPVCFSDVIFVPITCEGF